MKQELKEMAEMYALGAVNLTQLAQFVKEENLPLTTETDLMLELLKYAKEFSDGYEKWLTQQREKEAAVYVDYVEIITE